MTFSTWISQERVLSTVTPSTFSDEVRAIFVSWNCIYRHGWVRWWLLVLVEMSMNLDFEFMCIRSVRNHWTMSDLYDSEMKVVYYVTKALNQGINIKTMCLNYILESRNTNSHFLQVGQGAWVKIETGIENNVY